MTPYAAPPSGNVEIAGAEVAIATGTAANIAADSADRSTPSGMLDMLVTWFGDGGELPPPVAGNPAEALRAGISWSSAAMGCMAYGSPTFGAKRAPARARPVIDWEADRAIIHADFLRFYRIDLSSEDPHWYLFCSLLLALVRTEGSLVGQAAYARSPHAGARGEQRKRLDKLRGAWALPPTDAELREMARARF